MKILIDLPEDQVKILQSVARFYETDVAGAIEIIIHDEVYEMRKYINEDGIYEPQ